MTPDITYSSPKDEYGIFGNMAGGMPIVINGHKIYASEHLYLCGYWSLNYVGANGMGEILMMIRDCLRNHTEPTYNKALLNESGIHFLGEKLEFV